MDDDKNFVHNVIERCGDIVTLNFDDTTDIYICLDNMIIPIFQFIYFYYIYLYKSVGGWFITADATVWLSFLINKSPSGLIPTGVLYFLLWNRNIMLIP